MPPLMPPMMPLNAKLVTQIGSQSLEPNSAMKSATARPRSDDSHNRLLYLVASLVGLNVRVRLTSGQVYEGIFHGADSEKELGVVLKMARTYNPKRTGEIVLSDLLPQLVVDAKDFESMEALDVDLQFGEAGVFSDTQGFQTDTAISASGTTRQRELEKWSVAEGIQGSDLGGTGLESGSGTSAWDQFAANEMLFGVKTDFKEELYTTKIDKNSDTYKVREKEASRIAAEIEKSVSNNVHMAEERGQSALKDDDVDEEDRYGAIIRAPGSYVPPSARKPEAPLSFAAIVEAKKKEEVAIAKSSVAPKAVVDKPAAVKATDKPVVDKPIGKPEAVKAIDKPVADKPAAALVEKPAEITTVQESQKKPTLNPFASSFKFNSNASDFVPKGAIPTVPKQKDWQPDNIFKKKLAKVDNVKAQLLSVDKLPSSRSLEDGDVFWKYGYSSYLDAQRTGMEFYQPPPAGYAPQFRPMGLQYQMPTFLPQPFMTPNGQLQMPIYNFPPPQQPQQYPPRQS